MAASKTTSQKTRLPAKPSRGKRATKATEKSKSAKPKAPGQGASVQSSSGSPSKQDTVLSLLRQTKGTTIAAIMEALTGNSIR